MALPYLSGGLVPPPPVQTFIEVRDVTGKLVRIPLLSYHLSYIAGMGMAELQDVNLEIVNLVSTCVGNEKVINGPFSLKGTYAKSQILATPWVHKPDPVTSSVISSVTVEMDGETYVLHAGDTFTVSMDVNFDNNIFKGAIKKNVTVKSFNTSKAEVHAALYGGQWAAPKTAPPEPPPEPDTKKYKSTFTRVWIEKKQCFVISGFHDGKRYEVILGTPAKSPAKLFADLFGKNMIPTKLMSEMSKALQILNAKHNNPEAVFQHPVFSQIVACPVNDPSMHAIGGKYTDSLKDMIIHLNDHHKWSREAIAEWIDTLDEQPVFYPKPELERVANSATVVALQPTFS